MVKVIALGKFILQFGSVVGVRTGTPRPPPSDSEKGGLRRMVGLVCRLKAVIKVKLPYMYTWQ